MQILTSLLARPAIRLAAMGIVAVLAAACGSGAVDAPPSAPPRSATTTADGPLVQQLTNAVAETGAMQHMQALQKIADENGGNRAAGTAGYGASADYVVEVLRSAGFETSTPTYQASGGAGGRVRPPLRRPWPAGGSSLRVGLPRGKGDGRLYPGRPPDLRR